MQLLHLLLTKCTHCTPYTWTTNAAQSPILYSCHKFELQETLAATKYSTQSKKCPFHFRPDVGVKWPMRIPGFSLRHINCIPIAVKRKRASWHCCGITFQRATTLLQQNTCLKNTSNTSSSSGKNRIYCWTTGKYIDEQRKGDELSWRCGDKHSE